MALIPCKSCGRRISTSAPHCPHCAQSGDEAQTSMGRDGIPKDADGPAPDVTHAGPASGWGQAAGAATVLAIAALSILYWATDGSRPDKRLLEDGSGEEQRHNLQPMGAMQEAAPVEVAMPEARANPSDVAAAVAPIRSAPRPGDAPPNVARQTNERGEPALRDELKKPSHDLAKALLENVCAGSPRLIRAEGFGGVEMVACEVCPAFTTEAGDRSNEFHIAKYIRGHFFGDESEQIVAFYSGCEPHSANEGGRIIFETRAGAWRPVSVDEGSGVADACLSVVASQGRSGLVCQTSYIGFGDYSFSIHYHAFLGRKPHRRELVGVEYQYEMDDGLRGEQFYGWSIHPSDGGGAALYVGIDKFAGGEKPVSSRVEKFVLPSR